MIVVTSHDGHEAFVVGIDLALFNSKQIWQYNASIEPMYTEHVLR